MPSHSFDYIIFRMNALPAKDRAMQTHASMVSAAPLVGAKAGISLKSMHFDDILAKRPDIDFFEIHTENYMSPGGFALEFLHEIAGFYPVLFHGVGLSMAAAGGIDVAYARSIKHVLDVHQPPIVSEHLAWSGHSGVYLNDLLPIPYTESSLNVVIENVRVAQDILERQLLIENPSIYMSFDDDTMNETTFLAELVAATGCGILLDVNNVYVTAHNREESAVDYIRACAALPVQEYHLAGHHRAYIDDAVLLIDDHGAAIAQDVWNLYALAVEICGAQPTLIEWDTNIPPIDTLLAEAHKAATVQQRVCGCTRGSDA
jgi:uncharacterized protein (UPF0276 family)